MEHLGQSLKNRTLEPIAPILPCLGGSESAWGRVAWSVGARITAMLAEANTQGPRVHLLVVLFLVRPAFQLGLHFAVSWAVFLKILMPRFHLR